jgi:purine-binding chemotaxis protein CheW
MTNDLSIVGFCVGAETFGVPLDSVYEIVRMMDITVLPEVSDYIEGVINLRGRIIPVVDLRKRFREREIKSHKKNRILIAEVGGKMVGAIVDSASHVLKVPTSQIDSPPDVFEEDDVKYVTALAKVGNRLIILVDLSKILRSRQLKRLQDCAKFNSNEELRMNNEK